ncbi:MAG: glycoside hydrolase family 172 protein [Eubacteriales bacterium]|nr:glycoside hydrolase family 172 protein [Eubacteriales bacterium]
MYAFCGIGTDLHNLFTLSDAKTRSISSENLTGAPGGGARTAPECGSASRAARDLGLGWKVNPYSYIEPGETFTLADITGSGCIQHIWMTTGGHTSWRDTILRFYWDDSPVPSVECPMGDFFCCGWGEYAQVNALPVCVNPGRAFNCYFQMPFRRHARITMENRGDERMRVYYQITYAETTVPDDAAYFHASFRRTNPLPYKEPYTILDGVQGKGQYVGTYLAWGVNNTGWWGEGEIKFYLDGDREFPTICGTGTEDYFCGSHNFDVADADGRRQYREFSTPYSGLPQVIRPDGTYRSQQRFGLYRFHITDPIRFDKDLRVTIQALGWRSGGRYLPLQDDIASVAYWYQDKPAAALPPLPGRDEMEII